jgi:hypothetical protein
LLAQALGRVSGAGTIVWSLTIVFGAMLVTFALEATLDMTLLVVALSAVVAAVVAARRSGLVTLRYKLRGTASLRGRGGSKGRFVTQSYKLAPAGVLGAGMVFGWLLWRVAPVIQGDAPFHLGRVQKLVALDGLTPERVNEFADGGLHPGYAFPLWHAFLALVARIAQVDPALAVRHEASVLAPLAFLVVYEAGAALFRSRWLGVAVLAPHVALLGLSAEAGGAFKSLALPASAGGRLLLVPAALALVFAYLQDRSRAALASVAAAGLVVAVVHPSYALFLLIVLAGFFVARALLRARDSLPIAAASAAFAIPMVAFFAWLFPVVRDTASHTPPDAVLTSRDHGFDNYPGQIEVESNSRYRLAPEVIARAGPVPVAALAVIPLTLLAIRRRWAAFVLGATLLPLAILLLNEIFPRFVDAVSLSQARRLAGFLPFAFALAGAAAVLARLLSLASLAVALASGIALYSVYPGDFGYFLREGGPTWAVWIAVVGGMLALATGTLTRSLDGRDRRDWVPAAAALLFVSPIAIASSTTWDEPRPGPDELTPGLVAAVRDNVGEGEIVFAEPETSYFVAAFAPVYVAVAPPAHVADTTANRPFERRTDAVRFFRDGDLAIPRRYEADWVIADRRRHPSFRADLPVAYRDGRYTLYRLDSR